jgi:hypothetical protein
MGQSLIKIVSILLLFCRKVNLQYLNTGVYFELSDEEFQAIEPPDMSFMPIYITKLACSRNVLANPVHFRVTPLTVQEAEARGITNFTRPPSDNVSPSIAGR